MADSGPKLRLQARRDKRRFHRLAWTIGLATACLVSGAQAQQQLRQPSRSVDVDWSVLDEMDSAPASRLAVPSARSTRTRAAPAAATAPVAPAPTRTAAATPDKRSKTAKRTDTTVAQNTTAPAFAPPPEPPVFQDTPPAPTTLRPPAGAAPPSAPAMMTPPPPPPSAITRLTPPAPAEVAAAPAADTGAAVPLTPPPPPAPLLAPPATTMSPPAATASIPAAAPMAAPPPAAAEPPPAPAPQVASLPPAGQATDGRVGQIDFASGATDMPPTGKDTLDKTIAELKRDDATRLQIVAYATGGDEAGSQARRLSLSRALAVRSYLIDQGIRSTRMDVRALGNRSPDGPADRVDMVLVRR